MKELGKAHDKKLFHAVGFQRPHVPECAPQRWFDMFQIADIVEPAIKPDDLEDVPAISRQLPALP